MTAVVGILNKRAVAIAADSAATINGKIYNKALKIFTLSKSKPVGVMIYNNEAFMNTPLEIIIKMYRNNLGTKSFQTLIEYKNDFISFLKNKNFFLDNNEQKEIIVNIVFLILNYLSNEIINKGVLAADMDNFLSKEIVSLRERFFVSAETVGDFNNFGIEDFDACCIDKFNEIITTQFTEKGISISEPISSSLKEFIYEVMIKKERLTNYSGIVFTGYGESEIYPSLYSIILHFGIGDRLKYYDDRSIQITQNMNSSIQPFAQTDAMNTILVGIAPDLETVYAENFKQFIKKYNQLLIDKLSESNPQIDAIVNAIDLDLLVTEFKKTIQDAKQKKYINKLMDAVASLSKEDLAEMAESLIYLTFLQKRITFEQEDVGGAVDVAIISKGDGFIWIKRKHYFSGELNQHFFDNYFKE